MMHVLQLVGYDPLVLKPDLPKGWKGKILPGSQSFSYEGNFGNIIIQQYKQDQWCIRYTIFRFLKKMVLQWKEEATLCIRFVLQGDLSYRGDGKKFQVKAGSVNILWAPRRETFTTLLRNEEYVLFNLHYAPALVQQLLPSFPTKGIFPEHKSSPIEMEWNKTINEILDAPYDDEETLRFYFENKVREILLFLLLQPGAGIRYEGLTKEVVNKVHETDRLILKDLNSWLHIPALAKKVALSEFKLKLAFKQVIGMNMFERLREARLEKGKKLLLETDHQGKVIYSMVGFKSLSGFEDAFKEKYGLPPLKFRKKFQLRD